MSFNIKNCEENNSFRNISKNIIDNRPKSTENFNTNIAANKITIKKSTLYTKKRNNLKKINGTITNSFVNKNEISNTLYNTFNLANQSNNNNLANILIKNDFKNRLNSALKNNRETSYLSDSFNSKTFSVNNTDQDLNKIKYTSKN